MNDFPRVQCNLLDTLLIYADVLETEWLYDHCRVYIHKINETNNIRNLVSLEKVFVAVEIPALSESETLKKIFFLKFFNI